MTVLPSMPSAPSGFWRPGAEPQLPLQLLMLC
jgi:hypothetical protein